MVKRGTQIFICLSVLILLVAPMISAGLFDWFKEKVQMGPSDFNVSVGLSNSPPVILEIYEVNDTEGSGKFDDEVMAYDCLATPDTINEIEIHFLVYDSNGIKDLPGATGYSIDQVNSGEALDTDGNLQVLISNAGNDYGPTYYNATASSCVKLDTCPSKGGCLTGEMEYKCTFSMDYDYEPGTWDIWVNISDRTAGDYDDNSDLDAENNTFEYDQHPFFQITSASIAFQDINTLLRNQTDEGPLVMDNCGNIDLAESDLQGSNLTSDSGTGGDDLPVAAFSVSTQEGVGGDGLEDECAGENNPGNGADGQTADDLTEALDPITSGAAGNNVTIAYDRSGSQDLTDNLHFCIWQDLDSYPLSFDEAYSSTTEKGAEPPIPGDAWFLVLSEGG